MSRKREEETQVDVRENNNIEDGEECVEESEEEAKE